MTAGESETSPPPAPERQNTMASELDLSKMLSLLADDGDSHAPIIELVFSSIGDGVAITNATGSVLYFNAAGRKILGISPESTPDVYTHGSDLYYLHDFAPLPREDLPLVRALRGEETRDVELFVRPESLPDGALITMNARPLRDRQGRIVGGAAVFHDVGARKRAEDELRAANAKLGEWVSELERRAQVTLLMNDMADLLQSCRTMEEFYTVVSRYAARIFDSEPGAVYAVNSSRSAIEMVVRWGDWPAPDAVYAPDACWALRRGRMHRAGAGALGPECHHAMPLGEGAHVCIPMMGQGEALGVLNVRQSPAPAIVGAELGSAVAESRLRTIISVAEHVALSLANLKLRDTLRMQAIRDPLTSLFNRRHMEESFERELARGARAHQPVSVFMIDIDHFKRFNDTFGHAAADVVLRETASLIRAQIRSDDIACRFGGEELVVILPEASRERAVERANVLRLAISQQQVSYRGAALGGITASFGVATYPNDGMTVESLLRAADEALYEAKRAGRNRVCTRQEGGKGESPLPAGTANNGSPSVRPVAANGGIR